MPQKLLVPISLTSKLWLVDTYLSGSDRLITINFYCQVIVNVIVVYYNKVEDLISLQ